MLAEVVYLNGTLSPVLTRISAMNESQTRAEFVICIDAMSSFLELMAIKLSAGMDCRA